MKVTIMQKSGLAPKVINLDDVTAFIVTHNANPIYVAVQQTPVEVRDARPGEAEFADLTAGLGFNKVEVVKLNG